MVQISMIINRNKRCTVNSKPIHHSHCNTFNLHSLIMVNCLLKWTHPNIIYVSQFGNKFSVNIRLQLLNRSSLCCLQWEVLFFPFCNDVIVTRKYKRKTNIRGKNVTKLNWINLKTPNKVKYYFRYGFDEEITL